MAKKMDEAKNMQAAMEAVDTVMKQAADHTDAVLVRPAEDTPTTTETAPAAPAEADAPAKADTPAGILKLPEPPNTSGFYIYIGPNIKGLIQTGTIYRGNRANAFEKAMAAIEKKPLVKLLIVSGDELPAARLKVKTPGNVLYVSYQELAGK